MGVRPDVGPHCPNEYGAVVESILAVELPTVTPGLMCVCHLPRLKSKSCCPSRSAGLAAKTDSLAAASGSANAMQAKAQGGKHDAAGLGMLEGYSAIGIVLKCHFARKSPTTALGRGGELVGGTSKDLA